MGIRSGNRSRSSWGTISIAARSRGEVLDLLIERRRRHVMLYLKGNHETYAIEFLDHPSVLSDWKHVGGVNTLLSYGVTPSGRDDPREQQGRFNGLRSGTSRQPSPIHPEPRAVVYLRGFFLRACGRCGPGIALGQHSGSKDLLWIREDFLLPRRGFRQGRGRMVTRRPGRPRSAQTASTSIPVLMRRDGLTCLVLEGDRMSFI